jgi:outer membrane protein TolC
MKSPITKLVVTLFCSGFLSLQAATLITPAEVVRLTLVHSPSLKEKETDILISDARQKEADAGRLPRLDAKAQAYHFEGLENNPLAPGVSIPVLENQYSASIGITQPLYTGGRVTHQKHAARLTGEAMRHARDAHSADLTLSALITYWQWSKSLALSTALLSAIERTSTLATDTQNLRQAGLATDNDQFATEVLLDQVRLQFEDAVRHADLSRVRLAQLTGRPFTLNDTPEPPAQHEVGHPPTLQEALQNAISNRAELASLRLNTRAAMALTEATRADRRPQLALIARYEQGNPNTRNFPPEDQWQDDALIGAAVSWNLFDGGLTRARIAEARLQATKQQLQLEAQEEAVLAQVQEALLNFHHACSSLKTATHAESSAKRNLEVANTLWKNGSARHSDALDAEAKRTLTTAQRIAAESDVRIRRAALKHAMGDTP